MATTKPGWLPDPYTADTEEQLLRFFDGLRFTEHVYDPARQDPPDVAAAALAGFGAAPPAPPAPPPAARTDTRPSPAPPPAAGGSAAAMGTWGAAAPAAQAGQAAQAKGKDTGRTPPAAAAPASGWKTPEPRAADAETTASRSTGATPSATAPSATVPSATVPGTTVPSSIVPTGGATSAGAAAGGRWTSLPDAEPPPPQAAAEPAPAAHDWPPAEPPPERSPWSRAIPEPDRAAGHDPGEGAAETGEIIPLRDAPDISTPILVRARAALDRPPVKTSLVSLAAVVFVGASAVWPAAPVEQRTPPGCAALGTALDGYASAADPQQREGYRQALIPLVERAARDPAAATEVRQAAQNALPLLRGDHGAPSSGAAAPLAEACGRS
ncbi:DUF2510 domain-containing protein [Bailinhaonella thermotolerans]|uniref:DUF2510 domain-containing protein n=1 Tax=Bailinhaonella thermotolerans TaxID=1070861 RepID=A0A3A4A5Z5_9ACTN|nr:DUF2510 domain-containing protein [Bailinhaonella thermotolerans]RJL23985.1 DUF2510 domain-containing protein [Bailinhaonella thermotolerans]